MRSEFPFRPDSWDQPNLTWSVSEHVSSCNRAGIYFSCAPDSFELAVCAVTLFNFGLLQPFGALPVMPVQAMTQQVGRIMHTM